MIRLIQNELIKAARLTKIPLFFCLITGIEIIFVLQSRWKGTNFSAIDLNGQSLAFQVLNGSTELMILFMAVLAADLIADEIRSGTLTLTLVRPVSRIELLNAKVASFFLLVAVGLGYLVISSYIVGTLALGWGEQFVLEGAAYSSGQGIWLTVRSFLLMLLPNLGFGMIVIFIGIVASNLGVTIGLSLGLMALSPFVEGIRQVKDYFIVYQMKYFHLNGLHDPFSAESFKGVLSTIVTIGFFYLGSVIVLKKKDLMGK